MMRQMWCFWFPTTKASVNSIESVHLFLQNFATWIVLKSHPPWASTVPMYMIQCIKLHVNLRGISPNFLWPKVLNFGLIFKYFLTWLKVSLHTKCSLIKVNTHFHHRNSRFSWYKAKTCVEDPAVHKHCLFRFWVYVY